jgi:2-hydroxy-3-keto-5-methylthiopentenyl-1-phosphate phosphatase
MIPRGNVRKMYERIIKLKHKEDPPYDEIINLFQQEIKMRELLNNQFEWIAEPRLLVKAKND